MSVANCLESFQNSKTGGHWSPSELRNFFQPQQLSALLPEEVKSYQGPIIDLLINRFWEGNVPTSEIHQIEDLRKRQCEALISQNLDAHIQIAGIVKIISSYLQ